MTGVMDAVRDYFEARNRIWVTGDVRPLMMLARSASDEAWYRRLRQQLAAKRREMDIRGGKLLRSHSQIRVRDVEKAEDGVTVRIIADERVNWVYRDGPDYTVESRIITHRQRWVLDRAEWVLRTDSESGETQLSESPEKSHRSNRISLPRILNAPQRSGGKYNRVRALRYAELWWDGYNPSFIQFDADDCTNFTSQCLLSGNLRMTDGGNRAVGWWYKFATKSSEANWSYSWATANALALWLTNRIQAEVKTNAQDLKIGDVVFYDWQGNGKYGHSAIVVDFNSSGDPLVNAHTDASYHRHYLYLDSRAWTPQTRYLFVHVPDDLG